MDFIEIGIKAAQLFLALAILVTLHEFGHFIPAKLFKTRVEKFYLFFNPKFSLFRYKRVNGVRQFSWFSKESPKEWEQDQTTTEWGLGWIPLGGYVKIAGMIDESMDTEQMKQPAQNWEFRSKKAWQRLIIMIGGVTVNLVLGLVIYIGVVFFYGQTIVDSSQLSQGLSVHPYLNAYNIHSGDLVLEADGKKVKNLEDLDKGVFLRGVRNLKIQKADGSIVSVQLPADIDQKMFQAGAMPAFNLRSKANTVDAVIPKTPADSAGLKKGDVILLVNTQPIEFFDNLQSELYKFRNKNVQVIVKRDADTLPLTARVSAEGTLGFQTSTKIVIDSAAIRKENYSLMESVSIGSAFGINTLTDYVAQFKFVFTKKGASSLGGFASIGNMFPAKWDWQAFWLRTAFLSIVLAFMNILPIPALDGGHVVFLIYEMITGKEAPQKVLEYAQYVGIFLLLGLMIYVNANDIYRYLLK
jgi:regulator of sigma E protease